MVGEEGGGRAGGKTSDMRVFCAHTLKKSNVKEMKRRGRETHT